MLSATAAAVTAACNGGMPTSPTDVTTTTSSTTTTTTTTTTTPLPAGGAAACSVSPNETIGPYPSLADFVRSDIRENKQGTPLTLTITVVDTNAACTPVNGATVDIWQCDADGNYSQYEMITPTGGDPTSGYTATFQVGVAI